jgi:hypothetical protein
LAKDKGVPASFPNIVFGLFRGKWVVACDILGRKIPEVVLRPTACTEEPGRRRISVLYPELLTERMTAI